MKKLEKEPTAFIEVSLTVDQELADPVCNFIIENYSSGLVLEDEEGSKRTTIKFCLADDDSTPDLEPLAAYVKQISPKAASEPPVINSKKVTNVDWEEQYRVSVEPVRIEPNIVVRAPWHESSPEARYEILLEPKMAFGTGRHETTRTCLKVIAQRFRKGWRFLDLGCGSGVLSILADKKGAAFIKAIDYDVVAVDNCRGNFCLNNVEPPFDILFGSIEKCLQDPPYEFVCANIIRKTILEMLPQLESLTADGGLLLLAGLLQRDESEVCARLAELGLNRFSTILDNDWLTFVVEKA